MRLDKLIAASAGREAAIAHCAYRASDTDRDALGRAGGAILQEFLPVAGACVLLSAAYAARLRGEGLPAYVVAGDLFADRVRVFGSGRAANAATFGRTDLAWDGHAWVMLGDMVADASVCRTVRLGGAHPALGGLIRREFPSAGMFVMAWAAARRAGLTYSPRYVLTDAETQALSRSADIVLPKEGVPRGTPPA